MFVPSIGPYTPVSPVAPVAAITPRKPRSLDKSAGDRLDATRPSRSANMIASHSTRTALDDIKLGG